MTSNNPVERKLFHGTVSKVVNKICSDKFDRSFAGKNGKQSYQLYTVFNKKINLLLAMSFSQLSELICMMGQAFYK